ALRISFCFCGSQKCASEPVASDRRWTEAASQSRVTRFSTKSTPLFAAPQCKKLKRDGESIEKKSPSFNRPAAFRYERHRFAASMSTHSTRPPKPAFRNLSARSWPEPLVLPEPVLPKITVP